jgi:hypothetical protein
MKYIITEQRFERLVNKYLSSLGLTEGNDDADGFDIMLNGSQVIVYRSGQKKLYISTDLIEDMKSLFDLSQRGVLEYVRMWFQNEYNTQARTVWLLFPDEPFTF